jgi:hypothetical protein
LYFNEGGSPCELAMTAPGVTGSMAKEANLITSRRFMPSLVFNGVQLGTRQVVGRVPQPSRGSRNHRQASCGALLLPRVYPHSAHAKMPRNRGMMIVIYRNINRIVLGVKTTPCEMKA